MTTTTDTKTLAEIYVEATAEALDYYARRAEASRNRAQKDIATYAALIAKSDAGSRHVGSTADDYEIARQTAEAIRDHMRFLATGERPNTPDKDPATPVERIESTRRWINQELSRAIDAIAEGWSSLSEPHYRAGAALISALRDAEHSGYDAAVDSTIDEEWEENLRRIAEGKRKLKDAKESLDRARKPERIAELEAEIQRLGEAIAYFEGIVDLYRGAAKVRVDKAIGGRLYPRGGVK